jgi:hypothetical protein
VLPTSHDLLAAVVDELDASAAAGNFHTGVIRQAGHASVVLGFSELAERVSRILTLVPKDKFFAGAIMNFTPDAEAFRRLRRLDDRDVVEREIPPFRSSDVEELARSREATRLAWERQYDRALAVALAHPRQPPETSMVAEIAATAAVIGDFDIAQQLLRDEALPPGDAYAVRIVLTIEYVRGQRHFEAEHVLTGLKPPVQDWWSIQLALGLAGRRPWGGYPYADY